MKNRINNRAALLAITVLLLFTIISPGCVRLVQKNHDSPAADNPAPATDPVRYSYQPAGTVSAGGESPGTASVAEKTDAIIPPDNDRIVRNLSEKNGEITNKLLRESYDSKTPLITTKFSPQYNATALRVNITHGPLVILSKTSFKNKDPRNSFVVITVRDFRTQELIASETIAKIPKAKDDSEERKEEKRLMVIPREGLFHINIYGNLCDTEVSVFAGDSPGLAAASAGSSTGTAANEPVEYDLG